MKLDIKQFHPEKDVLQYYESKSSFEEAWNGCPRGDWMLWLAYNLGVDDRTYTKAKALCANTVRYLVKGKNVIKAIDAALRYGNGKISREKLDVYADAAAGDAFAAVMYDVYDNTAVYYATAFAASAASVSVAASDATALAALYIALHSNLDAGTAKVKNQMQTAGICREVLTEAVFEKVKQ